MQKPKTLPWERYLPKILIAAALLFCLLLSVTFLADRMTSPETYEKTISSIDDKKETVMTLTASSTLASAVVSAIPDDTATPIAEKLSDLSEYFLIVLCVLLSEKYLLTVIGLLSFKILIPAGCVCLAVSLFVSHPTLRRAAVKAILCAVILYLAIPASIFVSDMIYDTYEVSINETIASAEELSSQAETLSDGDESIWAKITGAATSLKDSASRILNRFIEALAVMIVTACVIPMLVLLFFIWLIRAATGIVLPVPEPRRKRKMIRDLGEAAVRAAGGEEE